MIEQRLRILLDTLKDCHNQMMTAKNIQSRIMVQYGAANYTVMELAFELKRIGIRCTTVGSGNKVYLLESEVVEKFEQNL